MKRLLTAWARLPEIHKDAICGVAFWLAMMVLILLVLYARDIEAAVIAWRLAP